jgi:hypothetical protein
MSHPHGPPDHDPARDPWSTPSDQPGPAPRHPDGAPYAEPPAYGPPAYGPPAGYGPSQPYAAGYPAPRTNGKAQAALWTGLVLLLTSFCGLGLLGFVPVVLGVLARGEIGRSGGQQVGDGMALAGIVTGALATVLSLLVIALAIVVLAGYDSGTADYGTTGV